MFSYGGGGYVQSLGSSYNESLTTLQDLQSKDWIDLRYTDEPRIVCLRHNFDVPDIILMSRI